jgi:amidase
MSRREFGRILGVAAIGGGLPAIDATAPVQVNAIGGGGSSQSSELCFMPATELAARVRRKDVSAREVLAAHIAQIERVNPRVNAIVTFVPERAQADAARADEAIARGRPLGPLHGLPIAHKDLVDTAGIRTVRGSPFYRDNVPTRDAAIIQRLRAAGVVTVGKTNTPEFGAGSQTFNTVFGATRNPYDTARTCGSRRAAVARHGNDPYCRRQ